MRLYLYPISLALFSLSSADPFDYGYWDVMVARSFPASGFRSWDLWANYSRTPGLTKHSSWTYSPVNGSTIVIHNDPNFDSTYGDDGSVKLTQSVYISDEIAVDVLGNGTIQCIINSASGRACSGSGRLNATCSGELCFP
ncbi:hypothetical protein F5Y12DRAFT_741496 [Xylaria sp. FL1777]|nr:hypothetical protein F5Y12DRAFT_741496 [Xylaria sp. FL1777]